MSKIRVMKKYKAVKEVNAAPMTRGEYNHYRNWAVPNDEDPTEDGYLVEYPDSDSNHPNHDGYISWCPKDQFMKHNSLYETEEDKLNFLLTFITGSIAEFTNRISNFTQSPLYSPLLGCMHAVQSVLVFCLQNKQK